MNIQEQEERDFNHTSDAEWDKEDARIIGERNKQYPWILSDRDAWYPNPYWGHYDSSGNPLQKTAPFKRCPHPEDYDDNQPE
tara:strand:- start:343 stop:588 length:246 start_codon:yes stop_codon:yes gene_type:complete